MTEYALRPARSDELSQLVAIDDDASELYKSAGFAFDFAPDHPFVLAEKLRWGQAIELGLAYVATDQKDLPIGFVTLSYVDGDPYLDQIAVQTKHMRRGVGTLLLNHAISWSNGRPLWLTTYAHIPWNKPYYERHGFITVPEEKYGPELRAIIHEQRSALPDPHQRITMIHLEGF